MRQHDFSYTVWRSDDSRIYSVEHGCARMSRIESLSLVVEWPERPHRDGASDHGSAGFRFGESGFEDPARPVQQHSRPWIDLAGVRGAPARGPSSTAQSAPLRLSQAMLRSFRTCKLPAEIGNSGREASVLARSSAASIVQVTVGFRSF